MMLLSKFTPRILLLPFLAVFLFVSTSTGFAATRCTDSPENAVPANMTIVTSIVDNMTCILYGRAANANCQSNNSVSESMFNTLVTDSGFANALRSVAVLFIVMYAISFALGIVQMTMIEFVMRMFKLSLIALFLSSSAWGFFYNTVGVFFQNGTNWLIGVASKIALSGVATLDPNKPFAFIDYSIATAFSPKMFITMMAMAFTGPYGWLFGLLTLFGLGSFVAALFQAVWIYLMSMIIRAFLFGLAPFFIPFVLFEKTRYLFDGWLNQLVNSMLQPALLFTFFAFFCTLIQSAMNNILRIKVCYVTMDNIHAGAANTEELPRFIVPGYPENVYWGNTGPAGTTGNAFPIDVMDVLIFLLLAHLASKFNRVVLHVARELAGTGFDLNLSGAFTNMVSPTKELTQKAMPAADQALKHMASRGDTMEQAMAQNRPAQNAMSAARNRASQLLRRR